MSPRWTYSESNAKRWQPLFDELLRGASCVEVPLSGNAKSLCSLKIRICDALKWLADRKDSYRPLKRLMRYDSLETSIFLKFKQPILFKKQQLDPALIERLNTALKKPDLKSTTRCKITALLGLNEPQSKCRTT